MPDTDAAHAVTPRDVTVALLELERRLHRHPEGHDQPTSLYHLYSNDNANQHPVAWCPLPVAFGQTHPAERLLDFADHMESPSAAYTLVHTTAWHRWIGMALCIETEVREEEQAPRANCRLVIGVVCEPAPARYWAIDRTEDEDSQLAVEDEPVVDDPLAETGAGEISTVLYALSKAALSTHAFAQRCAASPIYRWPELRRHPDDPGHAENA